jgi:hypothetical protein
MLITVGEIIERSWSLYAKNFKKLWRFMALLFIPNFILGLSGLLSLYLDNYAGSGVFVLVNNITVLAILVASLILTLWASMALAKNLGFIATNKPITAIKESFSNTSHLIWPVIYTTVMVFLAVLGGTVLLVIPGIIFSIWFCFAYLIVIFEEKRGVEAMRESKKMVVGRWWSILWRMLAPGVFFGIFYVIIANLLYYPLAALFQGTALVVINGFFNGVLSALFSPLTALTTVLLYFSAKENPVQVNPVIEAEKK